MTVKMAVELSDHTDSYVREQGDDQNQWEEQPDSGAGEGQLNLEISGVLMVAPGDEVVGDVDQLPAERGRALLRPTDRWLGSVQLGGRKRVSWHKVSWLPRGCGRAG